MTRRHVLLLGSVAVVVALVCAVWAVRPRRSAINGQNAAKIQQGMMLAEVEAIFGGPARDDTGGAEESLYVKQMLRPNERDWIGPGIAITIDFDADNRVRDVHCAGTTSLDRSFLDRVWRWLGL